MHRTKLVAPLALAAFLAGCTDAAKAPAEEAIKATEAKVAQIRGEAGKYAADQLKAVETGLSAARAAHAKGDFKGALAAAKELPAKAAALATFVADRRNEESRDYAMATAQVPQLLEGLRASLDGLAKAKKLPKGTTPAAVAAAREELDAVVKGLQASSEKASSGDLPAATAMARTLRDRSMKLQERVQALLGAPAAKVK
jgi:hypothetical protein